MTKNQKNPRKRDIFLLSHKNNVCLPLEKKIFFSFEHGSNNVSRWMTWLPISLKNAAKCDKWYQLQNHSITESLNAKGAWEKLFTSHPRACRISVSNNKIHPCKIHVLSRGGEKNKREPSDWLKLKRTTLEFAEPKLP